MQTSHVDWACDTYFVTEKIYGCKIDMKCIARMMQMLQRTRHQILTKYRSGVMSGERAHHRIDYNCPNGSDFFLAVTFCGCTGILLRFSLRFLKKLYRKSAFAKLSIQRIWSILPPSAELKQHGDFTFSKPIYTNNNHFLRWKTNFKQNFLRIFKNYIEATSKNNWKNSGATGDGAWIPYKRGVDNVDWFICYSHS